MKILAINNYSLTEALHRAEKGKAPASHCWGVDYFMSKGVEVDCINYQTPNYRHFSSVRAKFHDLMFNLHLLCKKRNYDVVMAFANPLIGYLAYFKKLGLYSPKLYVIVHHSAKYPLLSSGYERIFFLSHEVMEFERIKKPKLADRMVYIEWGPDLPFYDSAYKKIDLKRPLQIISNGKTHRDISLVMSACNELKISFVVITDKIAVNDGASVVVSSGKLRHNVIGYTEMLEYMSQCNVNIVPIKRTTSYGPVLCGLTSVLDSLALGMPLIISDNANIGIDVEKEKIGFVYEAGNLTSLIDILEYIKSHPKDIVSYGQNARQYAESHSYVDYCNSMWNYITNCMDK